MTCFSSNRISRLNSIELNLVVKCVDVPVHKRRIVLESDFFVCNITSLVCAVELLHSSIVHDLKLQSRRRIRELLMVSFLSFQEAEALRLSFFEDRGCVVVRGRAILVNLAEIKEILCSLFDVENVSQDILVLRYHVLELHWPRFMRRRVLKEP